MSAIYTACIFCEEQLDPSPLYNSDDWWFDIAPRRGIHYRCVDRLTELLNAIRAATDKSKFLADLQPCGHPVSAIVSSGTCGMCAKEKGENG